MNVGDKVQFSADFLKSRGQFTGPDAPTDIGPFARGTVIELSRYLEAGIWHW